MFIYYILLPKNISHHKENMKYFKMSYKMKTILVEMKHYVKNPGTTEINGKAVIDFSGQRISLKFFIYQNGLLKSSPDFIGGNYQFLQLKCLTFIPWKARTQSNKKMKIH